MIVDTRLVPRMAALDPSLMTGLPPHITAATGMDALTHAIEAFVGHWATAYTDRMALAAVGLIYENLRVAYRDGKNLAAREKMALASTYAGLAFTRANVGYVHAIAHQFGGLYHTPHGLANAIMLPHVLRFSSPAITAKLAALAVRAGVGQRGRAPRTCWRRSSSTSVDELNRDLGIPRHLDALREADIPALAKAACWEADTNYPVPRYMSQQDLRRADPQGAADARAAGAPQAALTAASTVRHRAAPRRGSAARRRHRRRASGDGGDVGQPVTRGVRAGADLDRPAAQRRRRRRSRTRRCDRRRRIPASGRERAVRP